MTDSDALALVQPVLAGDRRALARLLTRIEDGAAAEALAALFPHTGRAHLIGVTGAPGTGKSTLVTALASALRARGETVAILAVDPSSPFTGGAILGDRIRMQTLSGDAGVFIRSMAARTNQGGLARAARDAIRAFDAAGFNRVIVETVGAGQNEVAIARAAHTVVVVEAPGMGDEVQAIKAGILEIADVLVVNKADKPGAANTVRALRTMLDTGHPSAKALLHHGRLTEIAPSAATDEALWLPPIIETTATTGMGIEDLLTAIDAHRAHLAGGDGLARLERAHLEDEVAERLRDALLERLRARIPAEALTDVLARVGARALDPGGAVEILLAAETGAIDQPQAAAVRVE